MANKVIKVPINAELQVIDKNSASVISKLKQGLQELTAPKGSAFNGLTKPIEDYQKALTKLATTQLTSNNVETYAKAIQTLKIKEEELQNAVNKATNELNSQQSAVKTEAVTKAEDTLKNLAKTYKTTAEDIKKMNAAQLRARGKELGFETSDDDVKARAEAARVLTNYNNRLDKLKLSQQQEEHLLKIINDLLRDNSAAGSKAADTERELAAAMKEWEQQSAANAIKDKIKYYTSFAFSVQVVRQQLHKMLQTYKDVDAALTNISMVSGISRQEMWANVGTFNDLARELGTTTNEALEASKLYYQQGLKTNEVLVLTEQSLKLAAIAETDAKTATNYLTTAINGFKLSAEEASMVTDTWAELAGKTAVDVEELAVGISKVASIAQSAGMELQATSAFLTQIIETTREAPETAGTALKTIIARFQELKTAPGALEDGVDANKVEAALKTAGVALRDATGQFRDFDDVIVELSSKWDGLDRNTQRYIATIAAGSRQQSRFIALVDDYDGLLENISYAYDSAGAASDQFNTYNQGLSASLDRLTASWEGLYLSFEQGGTIVSWTVELLSDFLELGAKIGLIPTGIFAAFITQVVRGGVAFAQGSTQFDAFLESIKKSRSIIPRAGNFLKNYFELLGQMIKATAKNTLAIITQSKTEAASVTVKQLWTDATNMQRAATVGLIAAIGMVAILVIRSLITADERAIEKKQELIQTLRAEAQEHEQAAQTLEDIADTYKDTALNGGDLQEVQKQLISQYPQLAGKIDLVNGKYEENNRLLKEAIALENQKAAIAHASSVWSQADLNRESATYETREEALEDVGEFTYSQYGSSIQGVNTAGKFQDTQYEYVHSDGSTELLSRDQWISQYQVDNHSQAQFAGQVIYTATSYDYAINYPDGSIEYFTTKEDYLAEMGRLLEISDEIYDATADEAAKISAAKNITATFPLTIAGFTVNEEIDNNNALQDLIAESIVDVIEFDKDGELKNLDEVQTAFEDTRNTVIDEWNTLSQNNNINLDEVNGLLDGSLTVLSPSEHAKLLQQISDTLGGTDSLIYTALNEEYQELQGQVATMWSTFEFVQYPESYVNGAMHDFWDSVQVNWSLQAQKAFLEMSQTLTPEDAERLAQSVNNILKLTGQAITNYDSDALMSQAMEAITGAQLDALRDGLDVEEIDSKTQAIADSFSDLIDINDLSFDPLINSLNSLSTTLSDLQEATTDGIDMVGFMDTVSSLAGALDEEAYALIQSGVNFDLLSGKVTLNEEATRALAMAKMAQTKSELLAAKAVLQDELAQLSNSEAAEANVESTGDAGEAAIAGANDALEAAEAWKYLAEILSYIEDGDWTAAKNAQKQAAEVLESTAQTETQELLNEDDEIDVEKKKQNLLAQIQFIDDAIAAIDGFDWSTWKPGGGGGGGKSSVVNANKEYLNSLKAVADAQKEAAKSAEDAAKAEIKAIQAAITKEKELLKEKLDAEKEAFEKGQESAKLYLEGVKEHFEKEQETYEKAAEEAQERVTKELDYARKAADLRIEAIQAQIDAIDEEADAEDRLLELQKARDEYERARTSKTRLVLTKGAGWIFKTDNAQIKDAAENLQEAERDYQKSLLEAQIAEIEKANQQLDILAEYSGMTLSEIAEMNQQLAYYGNQLVNGDFANFVGQFGSVSTDPTTGQNAVSFAGVLAEAINKNSALEEWNKINEPKLELINEQIERVSQSAEELLRNNEEWQKSFEEYLNLWRTDSNVAVEKIDEFMEKQTASAENITKMEQDVESMEQAISDWDEVIELIGLSTEEIKAASELAAKYESLGWEQMKKDTDIYNGIYAQVGEIAKMVSLANQSEAFYESEKTRLEGYSSGGVANFRGRAMLHGSTSRPEVVLNNSQAAALFNWVNGLGSGRYDAIFDSFSQEIGLLERQLHLLNAKTTPTGLGYGDTYNFGTVNIDSDANSIEQLVTDIRRYSPLIKR